MLIWIRCVAFVKNNYWKTGIAPYSTARETIDPDFELDLLALIIG